MKEIVDQLTAREKKLLYVLTCFLIVVAGWFLLITPALDKKTALNQQYEDALMENSKLQSELNQYILAPDQLKIKQDSLKEIIEKYNPILSNEKIDKLLTSAFLTNGLKPLSLAISDVKAATTSTDTSTTSNTTTENTAETSYVQQATVNVSVSGSLTQITNTINSINKMKGVEISSFSYTDAASATDSTTASIAIIVYMAQQ